MKRISIVITSLFCVSSLIGIWMVKPKVQPEVIKIYKTVPYALKPVHMTRAEVTQTPVISDLSETEHLNTFQTDEAAEDNRISEYELSLEEEDEFWEWLASLDTELSAETLSEKRKDVVESETDTATEIPYSELARMVREVYEMESVLNEYGIYVDENGKGICPKCSLTDFRLLLSIQTNRYDSWCCMDCEWPGGDVIDFVAWREDIDGTEATRYLAERVGLLE